jgi:two-component system cell cycle sensor histidine kinase/response regulator CckA
VRLSPPTVNAPAGVGAPRRGVQLPLGPVDALPVPLDAPPKGVPLTRPPPHAEEPAEARSPNARLIDRLPLAIYASWPGAAEEPEPPSVYSGRWESIVGYTAEALSADPDLFLRIIHADDRERVLESVARARANDDRFSSDYRLLASDGATVWVHDEAVYLRDAQGELLEVTGYLVDISEAKQFEADLLEAEARNKRLVEQLPLATYIEHLDRSSASYMSPQIEALVGYSAEEWTSDPEFFSKALHPDDRERVLADFARLHETGEPLECEYRLVARDGTVVSIRDAAVVVRDETGRPLYAQGFIVDVSERQAAEDAREESDRRFRDLVAGIDVIVWEADTNLRFSFVSKRAENILGYPIERWLSEPNFAMQLFHPDDRDEIVARDTEQIASGGDYELEYRMVAADGRTVWFREIVRIELVDGVKRLRGVMVDVTAQKQSDQARFELEEQLRQAQKMEAVGQLAGGIAHDFNNLLTAISGYSTLALDRLDGTQSAVRADLHEIERASERAASLTQQLLAFSRKQVLQPQVLDLNDIVLGLDQLLRRVLGEEIELVKTTARSPLMVEADPAQLGQVLINLAINARDAMPGGGILTIESAEVHIDETDSRASSDLRSGSFAVISVADTGHGIDDATQAHLFEPFFTTKEVGKGTGLGLATVYGIVQQSDGFVTVDSAPGSGATFRVFLPLSAKQPAVEHGPQTPPLPAGSETILLVEDETIVRDLARTILELRGYHVLVAASPQEAMTLDERGVHFDLVVTDVVMPKMRGGELAERLRSRRPGLKVLFMSGYPDGQDAIGAGDAGSSFLQKPFTVVELGRKVRELLDADVAAG